MLCLPISLLSNAQSKYFTKNATITFYSKTAVQNIEAVNKKALVVMDLVANKIEFGVLIKGFEFEKALMQEHFNEDYLESDKYPKALFKGAFDNVADIPTIPSNKKISLSVKGNLTMHGVTKPISAIAVLQIKGDIITGITSFKVLLSDYNIKLPGVVGNNVSKEIEISVNTAAMQAIK